MAHGYYNVTQKPQMVLVHTLPGTANALGGIINAQSCNVPLFLVAGRTPITEGELRGGKSQNIHWRQESRDQGALVREFVKWDYELRAGQPVDSVVDRALDIAMTEPRGPVYLTLPREVLADPAVPARRDNVRPLGAIAAAPAQAAIEEAAALIAKAEFPLIITSSGGRTPAGFAELSALAEALGDRSGIRRFGDATVPMDESLATAVVDVGGRPYVVVDLPFRGERAGALSLQLVEHALEAFARASGMTLHVRGSGRNDHHLAEAAFKALARALRAAVEPDPRRRGVASTKGTA
jgi:thiamine pyrophosphate-dependent acetolactate synthase large subunit-like protein